MKFEFDGGEKECVAFLDDDGDLWIKGKNSSTVIMVDMDGGVGEADHWYIETATHKFYPGDKITITF